MCQRNMSTSQQRPLHFTRKVFQQALPVRDHHPPNPNTEGHSPQEGTRGRPAAKGRWRAVCRLGCKSVHLPPLPSQDGEHQVQYWPKEADEGWGNPMKHKVRRTVGMWAEGGGHRKRSQRCASTPLEACPVSRAPQRHNATATPSPTGLCPVQKEIPYVANAHAGNWGSPRTKTTHPTNEPTTNPATTHPRQSQSASQPQAKQQRGAHERR